MNKHSDASGLLFPAAVFYIVLGILHAAGKSTHFPLHFMLLAWPSMLYFMAFIIGGAWSPPWERRRQAPGMGFLARAADVLFFLSLLPYLLCLAPGVIWTFRYGIREGSGGPFLYFLAGVLYGLRLFLLYAWPAMVFQQLYLWLRGPVALQDVWPFCGYFQDVPLPRNQRPLPPQSPLDLQDLLDPSQASPPPQAPPPVPDPLDLQEILDFHDVPEAQGPESRENREESAARFPGKE